MAIASVRVTVVYIAALVTTVLASICVVYILLMLYTPFAKVLPHAGAVIWVLNIVPPFVTGFAILNKITTWCIAHKGCAALPSHLVRAWPLYVGVAALLTWIGMSWSSTDFWMVGQLMIVPCIGLIGALCGDLAASVRIDRLQRASAGAL